MVKIDTTKVSSKGQIVIPRSMRDGFKEGDSLLIIRDGATLVLKRADDLDEQFKEELEFARRTEEAYRRIEAGKGIEMDLKEFITSMKTW